MPTLVYSAFLLAVTFLSYIWVVSTTLHIYNLQLFAAGVLLFVILRKFKKKRPQLKSSAIPFELLILFFCMLIFIGTNQEHPGLLYPLITIGLFFFVFFSSTFLAISHALVITLFLLLTQNFLKISDYSIILMIPLLCCLFLFTKKQYDSTRKASAVIKDEEAKLEILSDEQTKLQTFIHAFLKPKLEIISELSKNPAENGDVLASQVALLDSEIDKQLEKTNDRISA